MPPRINYNVEIGPARAHRLVMEKRETSCEENEIGCWLFTGSTNTDGYGQVRSPLAW
jgi:hypothetical protein